MPNCVIHTPPDRKHHLLNYTRERILLAGSNTHWRELFMSSVTSYDVDVFDSCGISEWEFEHSFLCTIMPLYFDTEQDAVLLPLLGRHINTGKVIPCSSSSFPYISTVKSICEFEGISVFTSPTDLLNATLKRLGNPVE
jgi:hypothetical protein